MALDSKPLVFRFGRLKEYLELSDSTLHGLLGHAQHVDKGLADICALLSRLHVIDFCRDRG